MANIRKRGNSYQIRVSCGYDTKGNQVSKTMTWKPPEGMTERQAEKEAYKQAILFEEKCLMCAAPVAMKFEELAEKWFEEYARLNLRNTTYERMKQVTKRVYPAIGYMKVNKITSRHIQQFVNDLVFNGKNMQTGKPLARKTVIHHLSFISDVFSYAVKMSMVPDNPCSRVSIPKGERKEKEIYSIEDIERLFELLEEDAPLKYRVCIILAVYSGFRRGEIMGLEWKDVDFNDNIISVRRTSNYTKANGYYTDTTKTRKSQRSLKFPEMVMNLLKELKADQERQAKLMGSKWIDSDRLFIKDNGEPLFCGMPYLWLERFCKKHKIPFYGLHSIRHFFASSLIHANVDIAAVSSALGHSAITTTSSIYLHAFQDANARASEAIASVLDFSKKKRNDPDDGNLQAMAS
ncbi:MAG: site-specific integrase [Ruminiclostridium sp.]|uniref:tyrosine-type recombinase/integrase n=1 Tax=Ruminococcus sp. TaxID=41978 RepID=UPI0025EDC971|nr:site-specific integrase [Ruminococcus sp.]MBR1432436.1 site-specific integrase [Ruminococcus sp.]MBR1833734.1 site-specific integrase [Ruminiclostridium sp.]